MKLLQNILTTIDFSENTVKVIDKSILLARNFNSSITLLHVIPDKLSSEDMKKQVYQNVNKQLKEISERIKGESILVKEILVKEGVPFEVIINESHREDYNVIIAGGGDKKEEDAHKLGTTVLKLMRKTQIPLWIVKNETIKGIKKILCPVDFSDASHRALSNAITLARSFGAELDILNVYRSVYFNNPWYKVDSDAENDQLMQLQKEEFDEFLKDFNLSDVNYKADMLDGEPHEEILYYIKANQVDLLLIGTTGKTKISRLLIGSVTEKVTREFPCSFITTKATDIAEGYFESKLVTIKKPPKKGN